MNNMASSSEKTSFCLDPRLERPVTLVIPIFLAVLYIITCPRDIISFADSCEMVTASYLLVPTHPPGFPLYVIAGKLLSSLFFFISNIYVRYAAMTVALSFGTLVLLMKTAKMIFGNVRLAALTLLLLGLSREYWLYSIIPEVFSLNMLLVSGITLLYVRWVEGEGKGNRSLLFIFFIAGLGMNNHWTVCLLLPGVALAMLYRKVSWKTWLAAAGCGLAGFAFILTIFWLAPRVSPMVFALDGSWDSVTAMLTRQRYGGFAPGGHEKHMTLDSLRFFGDSILGQYTILSLFLALAGGVTLTKKRLEWSFFMVSFVLTGPFFIYYMNLKGDSIAALGMMERFQDLPLFFFSILLASGFGWAAGTRRDGWRRLAVIIVAAVLPFWMIFRNFPLNDRHDDRITRSFTEMILEGIPDNSILIAYNDVETFALSYVLHVEGRMRGILFFNSRGFERAVTNPEAVSRYMDHYGFSARPEIKGQLKEFLMANADSIPTFSMLHSLRPEYGIDGNNLYGVPSSGLAFRVLRVPVYVEPDWNARIFSPDPQQVTDFRKAYAFPGNHFNAQMNLIYRGTLENYASMYNRGSRPDIAGEISKRISTIYSRVSGGG